VLPSSGPASCPPWCATYGADGKDDADGDDVDVWVMILNDRAVVPASRIGFGRQWLTDRIHNSSKRFAPASLVVIDGFSDRRSGHLSGMQETIFKVLCRSTFCICAVDGTAMALVVIFHHTLPFDECVVRCMTKLR
jgi:hypothetical protein